MRQLLIGGVLLLLICNYSNYDTIYASWSTTVPGYIFGLARDADSSIGLGFGTFDGDAAFMASECRRIEWLAHDGHSFGMESVQMDNIGEVSIRFMTQNDDFWIDVSPQNSFVPQIGFIALEGMINVLFYNTSVLTFTTAANETWALHSSLPWYRVVTEPVGEWKNPAAMAQRVGANISSQQYVNETVLLFFILSEQPWHISSSSNTILFPEEPYMARSVAWKEQTRLSDWGNRGLANLLGNVGRFSGYLAQKRNENEHYISLTSIYPSRSKFPRPFLWDEGFHLLAIQEFAPDLAMEILMGWLNAAIDGWIPRELALSGRDRASIPPAFLVQDRSIANPTSLVLVIRRWLFQGVLSESQKHEITARLVPWFNHLRESQASDSPGCFRWHGRTAKHCLASGLDDYPRSPKIDPGECHVDLHVWLMLLGATILQLCPDCADVRQVQLEISQNLELIFLSDLVLADLVRPPTELSPPIHSKHIGYVTVLPFALGMLCDKTQITRVLNEVIPKLLGPFGLMSLAKEDKFFQTGESYWRGNIWANFNLLVSGALVGYSKKFPEMTQALVLAAEIRQRWTSAIRVAWEKAGGPVEYLHPVSGRGGGVYPFAGWTAATMVLMDNEADWWTEAVGVSEHCQNI